MFKIIIVWYSKCTRTGKTRPRLAVSAYIWKALYGFQSATFHFLSDVQKQGVILPLDISQTKAQKVYTAN